MEFILYSIHFLIVKLRDFLIQATNDIISILTQPQSSNISSLEADNPTRNAILKLTEQLK